MQKKNRTKANSATTSEDNPAFGILKLATPRLYMFEDGSTVVGEGKGTIPLCTGCKNEEVVVDAFARAQQDSAVTVFFALFKSRDAADLDVAIVLEKEIVVRDENGLFEFALGGGCHADGGGEMNGKGTGI